MKSIAIKEINLFFSSPIGYMVVGLFLLVSSLFLFVFEGEYNLLNSGYADMAPFFKLVPWLFIFLIPAITMRSFSDEIKQGTLELLLTKPLSLLEIVLGKFLGALVLLIVAILPSLLYVFILSLLSLNEQGLDFGSTLGSYLGLVFLMGAYAAVGIFASTCTENQIVSFVIAVFVSFLLFYGFESLSLIAPIYTHYLSYLGFQSHYKSISRGVIDSRDLIYFLSVIFVFVALSLNQLKSRTSI
jgi:ABC-2 type transport system permease protein